MPRDFDRNDLGGLGRDAAAANRVEAAGSREQAGWEAGAGERAGQAGTGPAGPPRPDVPEGASWQVPSAGPVSAGTSAPRTSSVLKVLAMLMVGCVGTSLMAGVVSLSLFAVGLSSCMRSCSDNPIGDSREAAAFIADRTATSRDLAVFDQLHGSLECLTGRLAGRSGEEETGRMSVDELRAMVAQGQWPKDDVSESLSPRVWVRIAELSQDWMESETGESWEIVDFSYPFPDSGSVPVPAIRDDDTRCLCRLRCTDGDDLDTYTTVAYYRWAKVAYFGNSLAEDRASITEREDLLAGIDRSGLLEGRDYLLSRSEVFVWETGEDDGLRDPEAFLTCVNELCASLGRNLRITLVAEDTPATLRFDAISSDYPNSQPDEVVSFEEARSRLLKSGHSLYFDCAGEDVLLSCYGRSDEEAALDDLTGTLAPSDDRADFRHPWRAPSEECLFDHALTATVAETLGTTEDRVIVASELTDLYDHYNSLTTWVIVPAGTLPETPRAFCAMADALRDAIWRQMDLDPERNNSLYVHIFELDEDSIVDASGETSTFAHLREVAEAHPHDLEEYRFDVLLSVMPSVTLWPEEDEPHAYDTKPTDVGGSIALSRDWRYSSE